VAQTRPSWALPVAGAASRTVTIFALVLPSKARHVLQYLRGGSLIIGFRQIAGDPFEG